MKPLSSDFLREKPVSNDSAIAVLGLAAARDAIVDCRRCARLREYCARVAREKKRAHRDETYWGRPVPGWGDPDARILLVGLAPAAHGANRTGRPFTGDGPGGSANFLTAALHRGGLANLSTSLSRNDGLTLTGVYVAMAVRCAPPGNKARPEELARCLDHLAEETACLRHLRVVVALGRVGFDAWLRVCRGRGARVTPRPVFEHNGVVDLGPNQPALVGCYHPSRQNTNTGRLTPAMLDDVIEQAKSLSGVRHSPADSEPRQRREAVT